MKVYCLFQGEYSDRWLMGVFETLEAAKAAANTPDEWEVMGETSPEERHWGTDGGLMRDSYDIDEREVQTWPVDISDAADRMGRAIG